MRADGGLKAAHKLSQTQGGFSGTLHAEGRFGLALVQMGDLDGDGQRELGVLAPYGPAFQGTLWILYLDADERVASETPIGPLYDYGLPWPGGSYHWRFSDIMGWLGDLDGDGSPELAVGASNDRVGTGTRAACGSSR